MTPATRLRHAGVIDWLHSFAPGFATARSYRVAYDDWGVFGQTASAELRFAGNDWFARLGYRFYLQGDADFYQEKYLMAASNYQFYTSDKELGQELGHAGTAEINWQLQRHQQDQVGVSLDLRVDALYYRYPDFALLSARSSVFGEAGLRLQF
jgi:hypothetical protein